jgi:hypothetical protein
MYSNVYGEGWDFATLKFNEKMQSQVITLREFQEGSHGYFRLFDDITYFPASKKEELQNKILTPKHTLIRQHRVQMHYHPVISEENLELYLKEYKPFNSNDDAKTTQQEQLARGTTYILLDSRDMFSAQVLATHLHNFHIHPWTDF